MEVQVAGLVVGIMALIVGIVAAAPSIAIIARWIQRFAPPLIDLRDSLFALLGSLTNISQKVLTWIALIVAVVGLGLAAYSTWALASGPEPPPTPTPTQTVPPSSTPTVLETSTPTFTATGTPKASARATPTARTNCDQMRGTRYRNPEEQPWFLSNCITPMPPVLTPTPTPDGPTPDGPTPVSRIFLEGESGGGDGQVMPRSRACGESTIWLHAGESRTFSFNLGVGARYSLNMRYSNDNDGPSETIRVALDGVSVGQFVAQDTGDNGRGWNVFVWSDIVGVAALSLGHHEVVLSVTGGDGFGVEIDVVALVLVQ